MPLIDGSATPARPRRNPMYREDLVYGEVLGAGLLADIASPEGDGPHPVILSVHGGRWIRGTRRDNGAIDVRRWAEEFGYFAMTIEYRLVTCTPAPACYEDVLCAIRWVHAHAQEYRLDTSRFYLIGMSAGGHMVSLAATLGQGRFACRGGWEDQPHDISAAISSSGAYDLRTLDWGSGWMPTGEPWDEARGYASPIEHIDADTRPLLLLHSDDDGSVPIRQAVRMAAALDEADAPHRFRHYTDRGHMAVTDEVIAEARDFIAWVEAR
jgi:acetyl esterase/lipase